MSMIRKIAIVVATAAIGVGVVGFTAPAHADLTWGYSIHKAAR
ncbi:hypothetical protein [Nocardioides sp.]|jgi:hypothetical protein|nr:hypothetical protein [Nocardioides sp.]HVX53178.1 hypothetical protein [Nocardioides sp.]